MSLINDALRRASQREKDRPRPATAPMGMEPVTRKRRSSMGLILGVVIAIALVLAASCFWLWWSGRHAAAVPVVVTPRPVHVQKAPVVPPTPTPVAPVVAAPTAPPVVQTTPVVVAPVMAAVPSPVAPTPVVRAAKPVPEPPVTWPADLKLTAVFYSLHHPRVILNGSVYGVGDAVQGITVTKIEKNKVTLEWDGHTKTLFMDSQ